MWECVSDFSVMFFCADSVQWGSKTGVDHCRSKGFVAQGFVWPFPNTSSHSPFQYFLGQNASGLDQPCGAATMLQTLVSGSHTKTCWSLWWDMPVHLGEFSYVNFLYFYGLSLFSFTNRDWYFLFCSVSFSYFNLFIDTFLYCLFVCVFFLIL